VSNSTNSSGKYGALFSTTHLQQDLKGHAIRGVGVTLTAQVVKLVFQLAFIAILARLLVPSDFGLVAMVVIFTGLGLTLLDGGLSMATIQRETISHGQVSNLFWLNVVVGITLGLITVLISPFVAWIYNEPELTLIMIAMSLMFFVGGFSVQHVALLKRQMRFKDVAIIDTASMIFGGLVGVLAALYSFGYWALIISPVTLVLTRTVLSWWFVKWLPSFASKGTGVRPLVSFGANLSGANFVGYITNNVTPFFIGLIGGAHFLGLYDRSFKLASIPSTQALPPIMNVLQSALSRVASDPPRLKNATLSLMSKVAIVTMLISVVMFISAEWIVLILLGEGWNEAVPVLQILALATVASPITTLTASILVVVGQTRALLNWKIITLVILLLSLFVGSFWGVWGVLWGVVISALFIRVPLFFIYASRYQPVRAIEFAKVIFPPLLIAVSIAVVIEYLKIDYAPQYLWSALLAYFVVVPFFYLLMCMLFSRTRKEILDLIGSLKQFYKRKG